MPQPNQILSGTTYWRMSPLIDEPPLVLNFRGDAIRLWLPVESHVVKHEFSMTQCQALQDSLPQLNQAVVKTASMMTDDLVWAEVPIVTSPTFHILKKFEPDMLGSLTLRHTDLDRMPWTEVVSEMVAHAKACISHMEDDR